MSLTQPDDYDDSKNSSQTDATSSEAERKAAQTNEPEQPGSERSASDNQPASELETKLKRHSEALQHKADKEELGKLYAEFDALQKQLEALEEDIRSLSDHLNEVEKSRRTEAAKRRRDSRKVDCLSAALFGDEPLCPECEEGQLESTEAWLKDKIVCSNEGCGFEREF